MTHTEQIQTTLLIGGRYYSGKRTSNLVANMPWLTQYHGNSVSEKAWNVLNIRPSCKVCGAQTNWINFTRGYRDVCSRTCAQRALAPIKSIQHKALWAKPKWHDKTSKAMKESHHKNRTQAKLDKLNAKGITPVDEIKPGMSNLYSWKHSCGEVFERPFTRTTGIWCPSCHVSRGQGELYEAIKGLYGGPILVNDRRAIKPKEIDIYLPELKLGFEYHGEYWHPGDGSREAGKIKLAAEQGIKLEEFWELLWKHKRPQQIQRLKLLLRPGKRPL